MGQERTNHTLIFFSAKWQNGKMNIICLYWNEYLSTLPINWNKPLIRKDVVYFTHRAKESDLTKALEYITPKEKR